MQRERIILGMGKVRGVCGEFCSLGVVFAYMYAQACKCMLVIFFIMPVILGGTIWGRPRGIERDEQVYISGGQGFSLGPISVPSP